jgi:hypothetical protein
LTQGATCEETTMEPDSQPATNNNVRNIALAGLGVLATISLVTALVVASMSSSGKHRTEHTTNSGDAKGAFSTAPSAQASDAAGQTGGGSGTGGDNQGTGQGGQGTHQDNGPQIVYFRFRQQPKCTASGPQPAIIEWKVSGATGVALSVDNPGIVGSYRKYSGITGSETLYVSCQPGGSESHVYTIYTTGSEPQRSSTLNAKVTGTPTSSPTPRNTTQPSTAPKY